ncbi:MAG: putative rane protein [Solirubrobacteraceae bacterium]|nr:putative rane protein [Solirubrobacteraceae bacterium]
MRVRTLAATGRPVPRWRIASFLTGLLVLVGADVPPLSTLAGDELSAHMVEHLLIADVAALLLVLGLTGPLMAPVLRLPGLRWARVLAHPAVALPLWALDLYVWHLPVLYDGTLHHEWLHALEHACFLFFGANLWMGLLGPLPKPAWFGNLARLGYIVAARMIGAVLANVFLWSGTTFYSSYPQLHDQSTAGSVMMVWESLLTIGLFCWLFLRAASESEEKQALLELAAERGIAIDEARITRAVSAGRGAELRRRLLEPGRAPVGPPDGALELGGEREQPTL